MTRFRTIVISLAMLILVTVAMAYGCTRQATATLAGVDSNHDGVRDDVEEFIEKQYSDERIRIVARELHRGIQDSILHPDSWDQKKGLFPVDCLSYIAPEKESQIVHEIEVKTANTRERIRAYWKANARDSGTILPKARSKEEACGFDSRLLDKK